MRGNAREKGSTGGGTLKSIYKVNSKRWLNSDCTYISNTVIIAKSVFENWREIFIVALLNSIWRSSPTKLKYSSSLSWLPIDTSEDPCLGRRLHLKGIHSKTKGKTEIHSLSKKSVQSVISDFKWLTAW